MKSGLLVDQRGERYHAGRAMSVDVNDVAIWHLVILHPLEFGAPAIIDCPVHDWAQCLATYAMQYPDGWLAPHEEET